MVQVLADTVAVLAALLLVLLLLLIRLRIAALGRIRREQRLRPAAQEALGRYLAGSAVAPDTGSAAERDVFLTIAEEALADLRGGERDRLVALLSRLGFTREAMHALRARRTATRRGAAETLAALAAPESAADVAAALGDRDRLVRTTCAGTLAEAGGADYLPGVLAEARQDAPAAPGAVASVLLAVARSRPGELAPLLRPDAPAAIRRIAVAVAAELRLTGLTVLLRACLDAPDDLAAEAARGLGRVGDFGASRALASLAADERRGLRARSAAAEALGAIGDPASLPVLERLLAAPQWPLRSAAARALARLGGPGRAVLRRAAAGQAAAGPLAEAALDQ
ncbi:MAG TPA: HEAT repeat domain-containing protein [Streptosporangiaceae bacterium]|nr:HEAT repeat domain-containing protein [Streptosporangiaceae bacterium]